MSELSGSEKTDERFEKAKRGRFDVFVFREANIKWILACLHHTTTGNITQGVFVQQEGRNRGTFLKKYWSSKKYLWWRVDYNFMRSWFILWLQYIIFNFTIEYWLVFWEWRFLMEEFRPQLEFWRVSLIVFSHSCCGNSKHRSDIAGVYCFLIKYFSFILCSFPPVFFQ